MVGRKIPGKLMVHFVVGVVLACLLNIPSILPAAAYDNPPYPYPEGGSEYNYSTGHYIKGPFLEFFRSRGGAAIFGYPQTEVFYDARTGLWVQYFDNVRMEWHPENPDPYKVQLGLMGEILGHASPAIPTGDVPRGNPYRRYFPETGHVVSFAFLVFYDDNGGLDIFGYPISEPVVENGRIVQYFQRARMEWHPERPRDERVVLGTLGLEYIQKFGVPEEYTQRQRGILVTPVQTAVGESGLYVWAFVRNAITGREGSQTVYIYVTDAGRQPVQGAMATISVRYPSQTVQYPCPPTDSRGIASYTFSIIAPPPGRKVIVDVTVQSGGMVQNAQTFFVPWY